VGGIYAIDCVVDGAGLDFGIGPVPRDAKGQFDPVDPVRTVAGVVRIPFEYDSAARRKGCDGVRACHRDRAHAFGVDWRADRNGTEECLCEPCDQIGYWGGEPDRKCVATRNDA
jgi:hypothetical protein